MSGERAGADCFDRGLRVTVIPPTSSAASGHGGITVATVRVPVPSRSHHGGVTVAWKIQPDGSVLNANLAGTTMNNPLVEGCVLRQVKTWHFPTSDSPTDVASYPFKFGVGQ